MMQTWSEGPRVLSWEVTRACPLHCRHCRANAISHRSADELRLDEMVAVMDDIGSAFRHPPVVVLTGGDPLERPDLDQIIAAAITRGLTVAIAPSVTPHLTLDVVQRWRDAGVRAVSISLDGASAISHDRFRGVPGTFDRSLAIAEKVVALGLSLQINTSISTFTLSELLPLSSLVQWLGVSSWELFFVIPTGRARLVDTLDAQEMESTLIWLADWAPSQPFRVTTVGAPQWIRVLHDRHPEMPLRVVAREARGFAFIDHHGDVYPSGYLPVAAGNVRSESFSTIYRSSALFRSLRDPDRLTGRCGRCAYRIACGGSRARAYAVTGNLYADDPGCFLAASSG